MYLTEAGSFQLVGCVGSTVGSAGCRPTTNCTLAVEGSETHASPDLRLDLRRAAAGRRACVGRDVQRRRTSAHAAQPRAPRRVRHRDRRAGSQDRSLHRLLPVRLRRLDREQSGAGRSPVVRPLRRSCRSATSRSCGGSSKRRGGDGDRRKAADFYAACMDEPAIEADGLTPLGPDLATHRRRSLNPDDLPVLVAHLHAFGVAGAASASARRPTSQDATTRSPTSIRAASACPTATTT